MARISAHLSPRGTSPGTSTQRSGYSTPCGTLAAHQTPPAAGGSRLRTPQAFEQQDFSERDFGLTTSGPGAALAGAAASVGPLLPPVGRSTLSFRPNRLDNLGSARLPILAGLFSDEGFTTPPSNFSRVGRGALVLAPRFESRQFWSLNGVAQAPHPNFDGRTAVGHLAASVDLPLAAQPTQPAHQAEPPQFAQQPGPAVNAGPLWPQMPLLSSPSADANLAAGQSRAQPPFGLAPRSTRFK